MKKSLERLFHFIYFFTKPDLTCHDFRELLGPMSFIFVVRKRLIDRYTIVKRPVGKSY